jgi:hypothetical protein
LDPQLRSPRDACDVGGVVYAVGSSADDGGHVLWTSDGRHIPLDHKGPLEGQRDWSEILALGDGTLYLHEGKYLLRGNVSLRGGFQPCTTTSPFIPFSREVLAANEHGVWLGGQDGFNAGKGWVARSTDGTSFETVVKDLDMFVHRLVPWGSAILACSGKTVTRIDPAGATTLKSYRGGVMDVAAEGDTVVTVTQTDISVSRNAGKTWKSAFKFEHKVSASSSRPVAYSCGLWLTSSDGCRLIVSRDAMSWEPVPEVIFGSVERIRATPRGFLLIGRGDAGYLHELVV